MKKLLQSMRGSWDRMNPRWNRYSLDDVIIEQLMDSSNLIPQLQEKLGKKLSNMIKTLLSDDYTAPVSVIDTLSNDVKHRVYQGKKLLRNPLLINVSIKEKNPRTTGIDYEVIYFVNFIPDEVKSLQSLVFTLRSLTHFYIDCVSRKEGRPTLIFTSTLKYELIDSEFWINKDHHWV